MNNKTDFSKFFSPLSEKNYSDTERRYESRGFSISKTTTGNIFNKKKIVNVWLQMEKLFQKCIQRKSTVI